jgi:hypothetical protein
MLENYPPVFLLRLRVLRGIQSGYGRGFGGCPSRPETCVSGQAKLQISGARNQRLTGHSEVGLLGSPTGERRGCKGQQSRFHIVPPRSFGLLVLDGSLLTGLML